jgi:eukaryotic-like serine/threonine-protein kinase
MKYLRTDILSNATPLLIAFLLSGFVVGCEGLQIDRPMKMSALDWTTFGGGPTRSNQSSSSVTPPLKQIWQYDAGSGIMATPLVSDSILMISTLKGELHAVDIRTGKRIGYITLDGAVTGTPVWNRTAVYLPISTEDETIESIDINDGSRNWRAKFGQSESSPLLYDKRLYVTSLNGNLYCINYVNGDEIWKFETAAESVRKPIRSSPATDGSVVVFGCDDGVLYAVDRSSGKEAWKFSTGESIFASPVIARERVVVGSLDGRVYCLEARSGKLCWSFDTKSKVYGAASSNDTLVFVGTADGHCYALNVENGSVVWEFTAKSVINSAPLVTKDLLYVGSIDKNLYVLDIHTGRMVWHYEAEGRIKVSPVIWNGTLLVTSEDNYVTAFK